MIIDKNVARCDANHLEQPTAWQLMLNASGACKKQ
jgi:hypothetical protein